MPRDPVFVDTAAMIGTINPSDALHAAAARLMKELSASGTPFVTSDLVCVEFLNSCASTRQRVIATDLVRTLHAAPGMTIVEADRSRFLAALDLYESRPDKHWSLVDCSSILICRERRIKRVFTHDQHFRQAGFQTLL